MMPIRLSKKRHDLPRTTVRIRELTLLPERPDEQHSRSSNPGRAGGAIRNPGTPKEDVVLQDQAEQATVRLKPEGGVIEVNEVVIEALCGETHAAPNSDFPIVRPASTEQVANERLDVGGRILAASGVALPDARASAGEEPAQQRGREPTKKIHISSGPAETQHEIKTPDILHKERIHEYAPIAPNTIGSPLKRKSQTRRVSFFDEVEGGSQAKRDLPRTEQQNGLTGSGSTISKLSRENIERDHIRKTRDDLFTSQRLMMVSLPSSSFYDSESDEEEPEEDGNSEATDDEPEEIEKRTYVPLEEDSGDDGDAEPDAQSDSKETQDSLLQKLEACKQPKISPRMDDWRPRKPKASNILMEVDEDILESSRVATRSLSPCIPETQLDMNPIEKRLSQMSFIPQASYFESASQNLRSLKRGTGIRMSKSMSVAKYYFQPEEDREEEGGMSISNSLAHTISTSPRKMSSPLPTLLQETPNQKKCLQTLTRQASIDLGTVPVSARRRLKSLPFTPPFLKSGY
jgi:hypothetical protein